MDGHEVKSSQEHDDSLMITDPPLVANGTTLLLHHLKRPTSTSGNSKSWYDTNKIPKRMYRHRNVRSPRHRSGPPGIPHQRERLC
ncbi:hypothetical protein TNCT_534221 [Trichonephila clavata]|uniref:Uncharacterized protein n=1 Tax=Trichonephila clavata TaxID=2740835 RepID=A0A8X6K9R3_TRICU|nr:hypothetical protein TNCT_534221 [Trichonephila clavata]